MLTAALSFLVVKGCGPSVVAAVRCPCLFRRHLHLGLLGLVLPGIMPMLRALRAHMVYNRSH